MKSETIKEPKQLHPIKRHRVAKGLTITDFAKRVGVTSQTAWLWETGQCMPRPQMYPKIAKALGITAMEVTELVAPSSEKITA